MYWICDKMEVIGRKGQNKTFEKYKISVDNDIKV